MSEMIERVAKKLYDESGLTINHKIFWEHLAKAAIEAMREPTDKMIIAASIVDIKDLEKDIWQAMIDEALK